MNFSLNRYIKLVKRDTILYGKPILYGVAAFLVVLIFIFYFGIKTQRHVTLDLEFCFGWYITFLFAGGTLLTTVLFWEFKSPAGRIQYLSVPASHLEKLLSRGLYTFLLYPIVITLVFWIFYSVAKAMNVTEFLDISYLEPWTYLIRGYFVIVSIILIFSIYFNKYVAPKTVLSSLVLYFGILLIGFLLFRIIYHELFFGLFNINKNLMFAPDTDQAEKVFKALRPFAEFLLWVGIPLFCWVVAYFKMKEKEV